MILSCRSIQTLCLINPKSLQEKIIYLKGYEIIVIGFTCYLYVIKVRNQGQKLPVCNQQLNLKINLPYLSKEF